MARKSKGDVELDNIIRFGPAGNSEAFYEEGHKHTYEAPAWLHTLGLNVFEYSFGRGAKLKEETGAAIRAEAEKYGIMVTVHAPYYINLANDEMEKNIGYFYESSTSGGYLGAKRVIFHPGSQGKMGEREAFLKVKENFRAVLKQMKQEGFTDLIYCPETMGRGAQVGSLEEVCELCRMDDRVYPNIDFGHLNARSQGGLAAKADFAAVLDELENGVGSEKCKNTHMHFSHIEYTGKGEKRHLTFDDMEYGPFFEPLAELIAERGMTPVIICESKGTQALDAVKMKAMYESAVELQ